MILQPCKNDKIHNGGVLTFPDGRRSNGLDGGVSEIHDLRVTGSSTGGATAASSCCKQQCKLSIHLGLAKEI